MREHELILLPRAARLRKVESRRLNGIVLVLVHIKDDRNLSAIMRTAEAFGIKNVFVVPPVFYTGVHISPKISMGGSKWLDISVHFDAVILINKLIEENYKIVATVVDPSLPPIWAENLKSKKVAIVMGNETHGLSSDIIAMANSLAYIPLRGLTESLNVAASTAIMLYEVVRQNSRVN